MLSADIFFRGPIIHGPIFLLRYSCVPIFQWAFCPYICGVIAVLTSLLVHHAVSSVESITLFKSPTPPNNSKWLAPPIVHGRRCHSLVVYDSVSRVTDCWLRNSCPTTSCKHSAAQIQRAFEVRLNRLSTLKWVGAIVVRGHTRRRYWQPSTGVACVKHCWTGKHQLQVSWPMC